MRRLANAVVIVAMAIGVIAAVQELDGQAGAPLAGASPAHLGIVVKDIDATLKMFAEVFGATAGPVRTTEVPYPPKFDRAPMKFAFVKLGGMPLELIQPLAQKGPHYEDLRKFGPSLEHVAFVVTDVPQTVKGLEAKGGKWVLGPGAAPVSFAYVDMREQLGVTIELDSPQTGAGVAAGVKDLGTQPGAPLEGATFLHVGTVVNDVEASIKWAGEIFGVPLEPVRTARTQYPPEFAGNRTAGLKVSGIKIDNLDIDFTQPLGGPAPHYDHLQQYGQSLQHIAFDVPNVPEAVKALLARGGKRVIGRDGYPAAYVDMREQLGLMLELRPKIRRAR